MEDHALECYGITTHVGSTGEAMDRKRQTLDAIAAARSRWGSEGREAVLDALEQATVDMLRTSNVGRKTRHVRQSRAMPLQLLTIAQVAAALAVSRRTVEALVSRGDLPVTRIGRATRIDSGDLAEWVRVNKTSGMYTIRTPGGSVAAAKRRGKSDGPTDEGRGDGQ